MKNIIWTTTTMARRRLLTVSVAAALSWIPGCGGDGDDTGADGAADGETGETESWIETLPGESPGDGFAFDVEGRLYCACPMDHCIRVFDPNGTEVDRVDLGDNAFPTNVCFGGMDRRTLFTTELAPGRVCAVEGLPTPGLPLTPWPAP